MKTALTLLWILLLAGCATMDPRPLTPEQLQAGAPEQSRDGVRVRARMLSALEAEAHLGVPLHRHGIEAAFVSVDNASNDPLWVMEASLDPDLYSADEAALVSGRRIGRDARERLRQHFRNHSLRLRIGPGDRAAGLVFLPRSEGGRFLNLRLVGDVWHERQQREAGQPGRDLSFGFVLRTPDREVDYLSRDPVAATPAASITVDADTLRARLEELPCCVTDRDGERQGDPLNLVLVGERATVLDALTRSGFRFTHRIDARTVWREIVAAVTGKAYPVAPVSDLYLFGRAQDFAMQRARDLLAQRNHLRLWMSPWRFEGRPVWVGQISRDIGIKLTALSPTFTTHVIDPQVDTTREYLLHALMDAERIDRFGFVPGVGDSSRMLPRSNLTNDPWFSDGLRLVASLSEHPVSPSRVRSLGWEQSAAPVAEGQSVQGDTP